MNISAGRKQILQIRIRNLKELIQKLAGGNYSKFGRMVGGRKGTFISELRTENGHSQKA